MATKDEIVAEVLLRLNGGVSTPNSSVKRGDLETYLVAAVNYSQLGTYWVEGKAEGEHAVNLMMMTPFDNVPILYSLVNQRYYSDLPAAVVTLPKGRSLNITTECGKTLIPLPLGDEAMQEYYGKYDTQIKYQLEGNQKVWYYGLSIYPLIKVVRPRYIASVADLPGSAEILLSADGEKTVLDLMFAWASGEKAAPKNYTEDGKDRVIQQ